MENTFKVSQVSENNRRASTNAACERCSSHILRSFGELFFLAAENVGVHSLDILSLTKGEVVRPVKTRARF